MQDYTLYSTSACHLCELAEEILAAAADSGSDLAWRVVDIADSERLMEQYGLRIPVLRSPGGRELGWPFTLPDLVAFLREGA